MRYMRAQVGEGGNKLKLIDLKEGISEMEIDISELKPALYFYVLTYDDILIFKDKIAIIK